MLFLHRYIALCNSKYFRHGRLRVILGVDQASLIDPKLLSGFAKLFGCVIDLDEARLPGSDLLDIRAAYKSAGLERVD